MSAMVKHVMKNCFFNVDSYHFSQSGVYLDMGEGESARIFAEHRWTLADFKAIKEVLISMASRV